ncbi:phage protein, HK97 gp10 family [Nitrosomonas aestuarii]|uniref:Phage protein, HK97 gp10 family n=1 Tax=Nitrosomonas aestuarii TaxID=52441 RepID=A0A1I4C1I9_9PROT|nr:HK97-gp10 family putative phage morphogenesis protein [Nitrosomonas aestuarii]SFK74500.1 phage protein, HK97 gp10 family [Nitrosomonas aestuarii]
MTTIFEGLGDLRKAMADHKREIQTKTVRRMVASGGAVLRKESKTIARKLGLEKTGSLIRNIAIKRERKTPPGVTQYNLGVRHGRDLGKRHTKFLALSKSGRVVTKRVNDPFYWRFHEFGTKYIQANEFIQQSLKNKRTEAIAAMSAKLKQEIDKANRTVK